MKKTKPAGRAINTQREFYETCLEDKLRDFVSKRGADIEDNPKAAPLLFLGDEIERIKLAISNCRDLNNKVFHGGPSELKAEESLWRLQLEIAEQLFGQITSNEDISQRGLSALEVAMLVIIKSDRRIYTPNGQLQLLKNYAPHIKQDKRMCDDLKQKHDKLLEHSQNPYEAVKGPANQEVKKTNARKKSLNNILPFLDEEQATKVKAKLNML